MDRFGKAAWILLLAGSLILPFSGCSEKHGEQFQTYNRLEKASPAAPTDLAAAPKSAAPRLLTSTSPAVPAAPPANPQLTSPPGDPNSHPAPRLNPAPVAGQPIAEKAGSRPKADKAAERATAVATNPSLPKMEAVSGTGGPPVGFQASIAAVVPRQGGLLPAAKSGERKVQLLVPQRNFKTEGPEGAWRVSYDDIDLLKVLNMDPVPANAATMMPAWLKGLEGRRIRIRGYMYPTFQQTGVHAFGLARDNQICCFGRNPKIYDVFDVVLRDGVTTDYLPNRPFDVVGVFHIRPEADDGKLFHLYEMDDATVVTR